MAKYNNIYKLVTIKFEYPDEELNEIIREFQKAILIAIDEEMSLEEKTIKISEIYKTKKEMMERVQKILNHIPNDKKLKDYELLVDYLCKFFEIANHSKVVSDSVKTDFSYEKSNYEDEHELVSLNGLSNDNNENLSKEQRSIGMEEINVSKNMHSFKEKCYEKDDKAKRKLESQLPEYEQAIELVYAYIESSCIDDKSILNELGITSREFNKHVNMVKVLAPNLYKNYLDKVENNNKILYNNVVSNIFDIANAVQSGYFADGTEFSMLEFWIRAPFKQNSKYEYNKCREVDSSLPSCTHNFRSRVLTFAKHILPKDSYNSILNFFNNYGIRKTNFLTESKLKTNFVGMKRIARYESNAKGEKVPVVDVTLNDEDLEDMINYILFKKLPLMSEILSAVQTEYAQGKITKEMIDSLKENKQYTRNLVK